MFVVAGAMAATDLFSAEYVPMLEAVGALKSPVLHSEVAAIGPVSRHSLTHALSVSLALFLHFPWCCLVAALSQRRHGQYRSTVCCSSPLRLCVCVCLVSSLRVLCARVTRLCVCCRRRTCSWLSTSRTTSCLQLTPPTAAGSESRKATPQPPRV